MGFNEAGARAPESLEIAGKFGVINPASMRPGRVPRNHRAAHSEVVIVLRSASMRPGRVPRNHAADVVELGMQTYLLQ